MPPRSHLRRLIAPLWLLLAATLPVAAQKSAGNTLTVHSRLIYVDVVVRDDYRRPVTGLSRADFSVKEDGRPQQIVFFQNSDDLRNAKAAPSVASPTPGTPAPHSLQFSNVAPTNLTDPSANIILLDLLNTPVLDQLYGIRQLIAFCRKLPPGHRVALFVLTDHLHMLQGFTGSSDQLVAAANRITAHDLQLTDSRDGRMQTADMVSTFAKAFSPSSGAAGHLAEAIEQTSADSLARRFRLTRDAFAQLARATSGYPGRKNLIWLAEDFPVGMGAQLQIDRAGLPVDLLDATSLEANLQIALYPVSLAGLQTEGINAAANGAGELSLVGGPAGSTLHPQANNTFEQQFIARNAMYYAMNDLARDTGGLAFHGSNDIAGGISRALDDGLQFYTLAYRPTDTKWNGQLRQIRVSLARAGYHLSYRRSYVATPQADGTRNVDAELAAALQPGTLDANLLQLRAEVADQPGSPTLAVDVTLDPADLSFRTDAAGHRHTQLLVQLLALPPAGTIGTKTAVPPQTQAVLNLDLNPTQYADLLGSGLHFREQLPATFARRRDLRLGVAETGTHRLGTLSMTLPPPASTPTR